MLNFVRRDPIFALFVIVGLVAGYRYFMGEVHARENWAAFKGEHACQAVSASAWRCNDGKIYYK